MPFTKDDLNFWAIRLARKHLSEDDTGKAIKVNSVGPNIVVYFEKPQIIFMVGNNLLAAFVNEKPQPV